jgi:hypothetical protein
MRLWHWLTRVDGGPSYLELALWVGLGIVLGYVLIFLAWRLST